MKKFFIIGSLLALSGCQTLDKFNQDLAEFNRQIGVPSASTPPALDRTMAAPVEPSQKTQIVIPPDPTVKKAIEQAMPNIEKVLAIHQCVVHPKGLLRLNQYSLPGLDVSRDSAGFVNHYGYPQARMNHNDKSKCISIRTVDTFNMVALNTLNFRAVYYAEDSGETVQFWFTFRDAGASGWLLSRHPSSMR